MVRTALLALVLSACSPSGLGDNPVGPAAADDLSWRTTHDGFALSAWESRQLNIDVGAGASNLNVQVTAATGDILASLVAPDGVTYDLEGDATARGIDVTSPASGLWKLTITARTGSAGIVPSWEVAGSTGPLVLVSNAYAQYAWVELNVPGALGVLRSSVSGETARHRVQTYSNYWSTVCDYGTDCELVFPRAGSVAFEADQGPGSLEVVWTPAELVLDQRTAGGTRTYAVDVRPAPRT
ncbi:MAG: hypothetical protein H6736_03860 [Alphaproteobacteria bacterium]|nr:hypothetical protein [Alphaproteobacteria bacterium]